MIEESKRIGIKKIIGQKKPETHKVNSLTRIRMIEISAETYAENETETLLDCHGKLWLNETHIEKLHYHSLQVNAKKQNTETKDMNVKNYQPCRIFVRQKIVKNLIMD